MNYAFGELNALRRWLSVASGGGALVWALLVGANWGCWGHENGIAPNITVSVDPATTRLPLGGSRQFTASVRGVQDTAVVWSVVGGSVNGTISESGVYTAPLSFPGPSEVLVRAVSTGDQDMYGVARVAVLGYVAIPAGSFLMGDGIAYCGKNEHKVTLTRSFYLGQSEVTNLQYARMLQWALDLGYIATTPTLILDNLGSTQILLRLGNLTEISIKDGLFTARNPNHPVEEVTWYGAAAYCDWLSMSEGIEPAYDHTTWQCNNGEPYGAAGYRLPTDAEWEYAAQYNDERLFPWGNTSPNGLCGFANYWPTGPGCVGWTSPVGSYRAEKMIAGKGLYDMAGNVWEWCNDWWECDLIPMPVDPLGPTDGLYRVFRGGSFHDGGSELLCAYRGNYRLLPSEGIFDAGFRVARTVTP